MEVRCFPAEMDSGALLPLRVLRETARCGYAREVAAELPLQPAAVRGNIENRRKVFTSRSQLMAICLGEKK